MRTLQNKNSIRTLSDDLKLICTCCETGQKSWPKSRLSYLFLKLVQIHFIFLDNVWLYNVYINCFYIWRLTHIFTSIGSHYFAQNLKGNITLCSCYSTALIWELNLKIHHVYYALIWIVVIEWHKTKTCIWALPCGFDVLCHACISV
jgi:hypothetical protein